MDADADGQHDGLVQVDVNGGARSDIDAAGIPAATITGRAREQEVDLPDLAGCLVNGRMCVGHTSVSRDHGGAYEVNQRQVRTLRAFPNSVAMV